MFQKATDKRVRTWGAPVCMKAVIKPAANQLASSALPILLFLNHHD